LKEALLKNAFHSKFKNCLIIALDGLREVST
jgi:hypothetical protein